MCVYLCVCVCVCVCVDAVCSGVRLMLTLVYTAAVFILRESVDTFAD